MAFANELYFIEVAGPQLDAHVAIEIPPATHADAADELGEYIYANRHHITAVRVTLVNMSDGTARDVTEDIMAAIVEECVHDDTYPQVLDQFDQARKRVAEIEQDIRDEYQHERFESMP